MRIVVYGIGAIGGTIAARLVQSGAEVAGIARGAMLEAIRAGGLTLRTPGGTNTARFPCHAAPSGIDWRPDDVVMLTMKGQDTPAALAALRDAGVARQAIVCAQNGVDNERQALRLFPNVFGMTVMMPAQYDTPGEVVAHGTPRTGLFDLGRYPRGTDGAEALCEVLAQAGFGMRLHPEVMASKHGKLLMNLANMLDAAMGEAAGRGPWFQRAKAEGEEVLTAAGIAFEDLGIGSPRREEMKLGQVEGIRRSGSSTQQSLLRGTGSIETDLLNGEIVLLGRLHGVPVPVNEALCDLGRHVIAEAVPPGTFPEADFAAMVAAHEA
jgi:2-dehydropantoate 2-reductase